jgi:uncharacterized protein (DUF2164 family)
MKKKNIIIELSKQERFASAQTLKKYVEENFDVEIGDLQADIFLNFISENLAKYYYNKGLADAQAFLFEKMEDLCLLMKETDK